jgi:S1-C subfamily serine protease
VVRAVTAAVLFLAISVVASGCGGTGSGGAKSPAGTTASGSGSFSDVIDRVKSGVIRIEAMSCGVKGVGTGFLVKPTLVATVEHVVDGATKITLKRDGRVLGTAQVIGIDRDRDLALLRTKAPIRGYTFGFTNGAPRLGEDVGAIGFPLGLPLTVTQGSVSGFDRVIPIEGVKRRHLVQTDAAVNPGNSGGPLLSRESGEVVGLVDLGTNAANGIAFAVSAKVAAPLFRAWAVAPQPPASASCSGADRSSGQVSASGSPTPAAYADAVDTALVDSARTRTGLADLIDGVNNGSYDLQTADAAINAVIDQRRQLLDDVQSVDPPAAFARSAQLLKASLVAAIADDLAVEAWIHAKYNGNAAEASDAWQRNIAASERATAAKSEFLRVYNGVRKRLLRLAPLDVAY